MPPVNAVSVFSNPAFRQALSTQLAQPQLGAWFQAAPLTVIAAGGLCALAVALAFVRKPPARTALLGVAVVGLVLGIAGSLSASQSAASVVNALSSPSWKDVAFPAAGVLASSSAGAAVLLVSGLSWGVNRARSRSH